MNNKEEQDYWTKRYEEARTGWDIGYPSTPIKAYIDQLENKNISILIPGAGNAYEAEYLFKKGFRNVHVMDISGIPLSQFKKRNPDFPDDQLLLADFFDHKGSYDLIFEQTFFCSLVPIDENRNAYARHMNNLLKEGGKLTGLWFDFPLKDDFEKRPFGGDKTTYLKHLTPFFEVNSFEKSYNSIPERDGQELFGIFIKK